MKTTVRGVILETTGEQRTILDELMFCYCAAVRWSFKRLLDGWKTQDIRLLKSQKFSYPMQHYQHRDVNVYVF